MLGIHEYGTTMTITIKPVKLEARKVNLIVRDIMIQPGFNNAHNVWLTCFNQQAQFIKLGDKATALKNSIKSVPAFYVTDLTELPPIE